MASCRCENSFSSVTEKEDTDSVSLTEVSDENKDDRRLSILQSSDADSNISFCSDIGERSEYYCDPCKEDEKFLPAEGFCVDCDEYLCKDCFSFHKKQKALKLHVLKDKPNMPQERGDVVIRDVCVEQCPSHTDKVIEYFCQSCDQVGCSACIVTEHRTCTKVDFIPDIIDGIENSEELKSLNNSMQDLLVKLSHHRNRAESNIERSVYYRRKAKENINIQRGEINKLFDKLEKEIHTKVDRIYKEDRENLSSITYLVNSLTSDLSEMSSNLQRNSKKPCQLFVSSKKMKQKMPEIKRTIKTLESQNKVQYFQFSPAQNLQDTLANTELGKVVFLNSERARVVSTFSYIDAKHNQDFTKMLCRATGLCLLPNNRLALTDEQHESCKLIDISQKRVTFRFEFDTEPFDVTKMHGNQIAVTLPVKGEIAILKVSADDTLTKVRSIDTGRCCCGICYSNDKFVVTFKRCLDSKPRIIIFDTTGTMVNIVEKDEHGRSLFALPLYVTLSPDRSTIYVSDKKSKAITALTREGKVKAVYRMETYPSGIAVDEAGSVYVCVVRYMSDDLVKSDIVQLNENCETVNTLVQLDKHYSCITYLDEKKTFYLAGTSGFENQHVLVVKTARVIETEKT